MPFTHNLFFYTMGLINYTCDILIYIILCIGGIFMNYTVTVTNNNAVSLEEGTRIFLDASSVASEQEMQIQVSFCDEPKLYISCEKKDNQSVVSITCQQAAHYFRGLNWAVHHLEEAHAELSEPVIFAKNGIMMDSSRNSVFTVKKVKEYILTLAKLGLNSLMLYTEETYEIPDEPYFGAYRGRYSQNELKELDSYAALFGIELIPCIQTLAHLHNYLRWPMTDQDIIDGADIIMVGEEKTYALIEKMLTTVKETFSTNRVHLGMDEAVALGLGNYLRKNGYRKSSLLIKEHTDRVYAICQKLGLEPMMWSDMYITSNTGGGYYSVTDTTDAADWKKPEKGMGLIYWDYYNNDIQVYRNMLRIHKQLSDNIVFAGGSWIWNGISPNYSRAFQTTIPALTACREAGIEQIFCTAWMDNGAETPVDAVLPTVALFGYLGFHEEYDAEQYAKEFELCMNAKLEDFYQLEGFDTLFVGMGNNMPSDNPSKYLLYQDALLGIFDHHIKEVDTRTYYNTLADRLASCIESSPAYKKLFSYYQKLAQVLSSKADLGVRIEKAYREKNTTALEIISNTEIPALVFKLSELRLMREELWLQDAKPFGYELIDIRIGAVVTRLDSARRRIVSWLDGNVETLEELEHPRLPYFPVENPVGHAQNYSMSENRWNKIISGCDLIDTI